MKDFLHSTRNDLATAVRRRIIDLLNRQLADLLDLGLQTRQAHWNVKGPNFAALHELFDKLAVELAEFSDDIAERAVALGGFANGTTQAVALGTQLKAYPGEASAESEHVTAVADRLATFGKLARNAIDAADEAGDKSTSDLFTGVSRQIDKDLWLTEAHLH